MISCKNKQGSKIHIDFSDTGSIKAIMHLNKWQKISFLRFISYRIGVSRKVWTLITIFTALTLDVQEWNWQILSVTFPNDWIYQLHHPCLCCGLGEKPLKLSLVACGHRRGTPQRLENNLSLFFFQHPKIIAGFNNVEEKTFLSHSWIYSRLNCKCSLI